MLGGTGNDTYIYTTGNDTFSEAGGDGVDEIIIASSTGLTQANLNDLYRFGDDLLLFFDNGGRVTIHDYASTVSRIETITFESDSSVIDLASIISERFEGTDKSDNLNISGEQYQVLTVNGNDGNDIIQINTASGILHGGNGYDTLIGASGSDDLYGGNQDDFLSGMSGDDELYGGDGHDTLDGGAGNDTLRGGEGRNTYIFGVGYGNDFVDQEAYYNQEDRIVFDASVSVSDVELVRVNPNSNPDLTFRIISTGEELTVDSDLAP